MARFRFGVGEYKYFAAPLPAIVRTLREDAVRAAGADRQPVGRVDCALKTEERLRVRIPPTLDEFLARCHAAGQTRPTPLLLSYHAGGYNCLHQDLYGDLAFPLQVVFALSRAGRRLLRAASSCSSSSGRAPSRAATPSRSEQGAGVVFATRERPVAGTRGVLSRRRCATASAPSPPAPA